MLDGVTTLCNYDEDDMERDNKLWQINVSLQTHDLPVARI
jgi:hypothetical protein